jgi:hypothetical protein
VSTKIISSGHGPRGAGDAEDAESEGSPPLGSSIEPDPGITLGAGGAVTAGGFGGGDAESSFAPPPPHPARTAAIVKSDKPPSPAPNALFFVRRIARALW